MFLRNRRESKKDLTQDLREVSGPSADHSTGYKSLIRNGLNGRIGVKKPFLRKGNGVTLEFLFQIIVSMFGEGHER